MNLTDLANKYKTDKGTEYSRGSGPLGYTAFYQQLFEARRLEPLTLLEIGVAQGGSLRMWREYFPNAVIVGIDIRPEPVEGCTVVYCNQNNAEGLRALAEEHGPFDIVLDDGSHKTKDQQASFTTLFPDHVCEGGLYVIEDLTDEQLAHFLQILAPKAPARFTSETGWHVLAWER